MRVSLTISCTAQVLASHLRGLVQDRSRAVAPRTAISTCNNWTALRAVTASDALSLFGHPSSPPGDCPVTVEATAFRKAVLSGVVLNAAALITGNIRLGDRPIHGGPRGGDRHRRPDLGCASGARHRNRVVEIPPQLERAPTTWAIFEEGGQRPRIPQVSAQQIYDRGIRRASSCDIKSQRTRGHRLAGVTLQGGRPQAE